MDEIAVRRDIHLEADATASASALHLRPWRPHDASALVELCRDPALRRWTSIAVDDQADARAWVREQERGRESGDRLAFALVEDGREIVGHAVLKGLAAGADTAEVGYWTAAHARGRGIAPRALGTLTDWAFTEFAALTRLELLHQADNTASCRVAQKSGYALAATLPAAPPEYPLDGHLHVRRRAS